VHASCEDKEDDVKDSFCQELGRVCDHFPGYNINTLLGDFSAKIGRESILKPTIEKEISQEISYDNGIRAANFATTKNLVVKSTMLPHRKIHKHTRTSPEGNTNNQTDHVIIDRRRHSSALDVRSFRGADCDTDSCLVVVKVRERLAVSK
jgi:hypothetical protein